MTMSVADCVQCITDRLMKLFCVLSSAPASAASPAPSTNRSETTRPNGTPISSAMSRLEAPARTSMPMRVWLTSRYSASATSTPAARITRRYDG